MLMPAMSEPVMASPSPPDPSPPVPPLLGLLLGLLLGELSVMSVLTALYPAGTIILAALVLRERIAIVQYVGLALAITAAAMLALT